MHSALAYSTAERVFFAFPCIFIPFGVGAGLLHPIFVNVVFRPI